MREVTEIKTLLVLALVLAIPLFAVTACGATSVTATPGVKGQATAAHKHQAEGEHTHEMAELAAVSLHPGEKLKVVATTSIIADVVKNVGGDWIELTQLMPVGADPHSFEPTPRDVVTLADAHVVFANGIGLEAFLEPLLESAGAEDKTVHVSHGIELLVPNDDRDQEREGADPHTWTAPTNVLVWVQNIERALKDLDPENFGAYEATAGAYEKELKELDRWVREQLARIPETEREIVTDHLVFAYFADEYGLSQVGAVVPGYSSLAQPSAEDVAALEDAIEELAVKAVFVGYTANSNLAQRVADDTGTQLVFLYTGSLSEAGGEADNYLDYVRYNVRAIVNALE